MSPPSGASAEALGYSALWSESKGGVASPSVNTRSSQVNPAPSAESMLRQPGSGHDEIEDVPDAMVGAVNDDSTFEIIDQDSAPFWRNREGNAASAAPGNHIGRMRAKQQYQMDKMNELSVRNGQAIADSMSKRVRLLKEKNALQAFSLVKCVEEKNKKKRAEFFR